MKLFRKVKGNLKIYTYIFFSNNVVILVLIYLCIYFFFFRNSVEIFTNPKHLVFEPQDLESSGPSKEIFYTPTDNINTNPITPPNIKHYQSYFPSPLKLEENEPRTSLDLLSSIKKDSDEEKSNAKAGNSRKVDEEQIDQENNNINYGLIDVNSEIKNKKPKFVRFSSSVA